MMGISQGYVNGISLCRPSPKARPPSTITLAYHASGVEQGFLASITPAIAGLAVGFEYDAAGHLTRQTLPGGREIRYGYDANGNPSADTCDGNISILLLRNEIQWIGPRLKTLISCS